MHARKIPTIESGARTTISARFPDNAEEIRGRVRRRRFPRHRNNRFVHDAVLPPMADSSSATAPAIPATADDNQCTQGSGSVHLDTRCTVRGWGRSEPAPVWLLAAGCLGVGVTQGVRPSTPSSPRLFLLAYRPRSTRPSCRISHRVRFLSARNGSVCDQTPGVERHPMAPCRATVPPSPVWSLNRLRRAFRSTRARRRAVGEHEVAGVELSHANE